jgi:hypothetical protein
MLREASFDPMSNLADYKSLHGSLHKMYKFSLSWEMFTTFSTFPTTTLSSSAIIPVCPIETRHYSYIVNSLFVRLQTSHENIKFNDRRCFELARHRLLVSLFVHVLVEFFHTKKESIAAINSLMLSSKPRTRDLIEINWGGYRGN